MHSRRGLTRRLAISIRRRLLHRQGRPCTSMKFRAAWLAGALGILVGCATPSPQKPLPDPTPRFPLPVHDEPWYNDADWDQFYVVHPDGTTWERGHLSGQEVWRQVEW